MNQLSTLRLLYFIFTGRVEDVDAKKKLLLCSQFVKW